MLAYRPNYPFVVGRLKLGHVRAVGGWLDWWRRAGKTTTTEMPDEVKLLSRKLAAMFGKSEEEGVKLTQTVLRRMTNELDDVSINSINALKGKAGLRAKAGADEVVKMLVKSGNKTEADFAEAIKELMGGVAEATTKVLVDSADETLKAASKAKDAAKEAADALGSAKQAGDPTTIAKAQALATKTSSAFQELATSGAKQVALVNHVVTSTNPAKLAWYIYRWLSVGGVVAGGLLGAFALVQLTEFGGQTLLAVLDELKKRLNGGIEDLANALLGCDMQSARKKITDIFAMEKFIDAYQLESNLLSSDSDGKYSFPPLNSPVAGSGSPSIQTVISSPHAYADQANELINKLAKIHYEARCKGGIVSSVVVPVAIGLGILAVAVPVAYYGFGWFHAARPVAFAKPVQPTRMATQPSPKKTTKKKRK